MTRKPVEIVRLAGESSKYKSELEWWNLFLRGFMAGIYIAIGGALCIVCSTDISARFGLGMAKLISGAVFPVGLIAIVLTGAELFTGDVMLLTMGAMQGKTNWRKVLYVLIIVYIGNFAGSLFWAYITVVGPFQTGTTAGSALNAFGYNAIKIAVEKTLSYKAAGLSGLWSALVKGIGCNMLVSVAILLVLSSRSMIGKFFGAWFPIMAFVSSGLEHCVANMFFIPTAMLCFFLHPGLDLLKIPEPLRTLLINDGGISTNGLFTWNLLPVTIGNVVGGIMIGAAYYVAFRKELKSPQNEL